MKRRTFLKDSLLLSTGLAAGCRLGRKAADSGTKIILIGLDGANWPTMDPLIKKGKLPFFKKLKQESAWADFTTFKPTKSSVIWTSIATGKTMEKHGILDFHYYSKSNLPVPYSNAEKREPSIWQILDEFNKKCIVLNWFVSHPPDKIDGIIVSDVFKRLISREEERIDEYINSVNPTIYFHKFAQFVNRDYNDVLARTGLPDFPKMHAERRPDEDLGSVPLLKGYNTFVLHDHLISEISNNLFHTKEFDFFATYIRMPDVVQHFSLRLLDKPWMEEVLLAIDNKTITAEKHQQAIEKISDLMEPVYQYTEKFLQQFLNYKKYQDATFIIVSDHGFSLFPGGYNHYDLPEAFPAPAGIFMMKGPDVRPGYYKNINIYDIAPTILGLFNLPLGKNMDGRYLLETLRSNRRIRYKKYTLQETLKRDSKRDKETLNELKTLGYISE